MKLSTIMILIAGLLPAVGGARTSTIPRRSLSGKEDKRAEKADKGDITADSFFKADGDEREAKVDSVKEDDSDKEDGGGKKDKKGTSDMGVPAVTANNVIASNVTASTVTASNVTASTVTASNMTASTVTASNVTASNVMVDSDNDDEDRSDKAKKGDNDEKEEKRERRY